MRTHLALDKTEKQSRNLSEIFYRKRLRTTRSWFRDSAEHNRICQCVL